MSPFRTRFGLVDWGPICEGPSLNAPIAADLHEVHHGLEDRLAKIFFAVARFFSERRLSNGAKNFAADPFQFSIRVLRVLDPRKLAERRSHHEGEGEGIGVRHVVSSRGSSDPITGPGE